MIDVTLSANIISTMNSCDIIECLNLLERCHVILYNRIVDKFCGNDLDDMLEMEQQQ